jgi:uncharacterized cofD-like protein
MEPHTSPHIVVIGGGTGSFTVLSSLKDHTGNISAVVNMSDDGGSTGILRDELGALPPGDVRQCLVALSRAPETLRTLFNYRYDGGTLGGHAFGNLLLTALEKTTGNFGIAVQTASKILNITGQVLPVTLGDCKLIHITHDGETISGQRAVAGHTMHPGIRPELRLEPSPALNPKVKRALKRAELIVIAPGNLYASLAPTLLVDGLSEAIKESTAPIVLITNLVTKPGQTDGFKVGDFADEIERFIGSRAVDYVIYNNQRPDAVLLEKYAAAGEYWVGIDEESLHQAHYQAIGIPLVSGDIPTHSPGDTLIRRTLIRHDGERLAQTIMSLLPSHYQAKKSLSK